MWKKDVLVAGGKGILLLALAVGLVPGCAIEIQKRHTSDAVEIKRLKGEVTKVQEEKEREIARMKAAQAELERLLKKEIEAKEVKVEQLKRGLVVTFLAEVLFDSGKAVLRPESYDVLDRVAGVVKNQLRDRNISIEGHTDNEPIKVSGWKSNWELSTARALAVLHYFVGKRDIDPGKVAAAGYGEFQPVADNSTAEGRQKNRRVEIVILPEEVVKAEKPAAQPEATIK